MLPKMVCHSKLNVTLMECYSKWIITQNGVSFKIEWHPRWNGTKKKNFTQNGMSIKSRMSLKMECQSNWNVTQSGMSNEI